MKTQISKNNKNWFLETYFSFFPLYHIFLKKLNENLFLKYRNDITYFGGKLPRILTGEILFYCFYF